MPVTRISARRRLFLEGRRRAVDRVALLGVHRAAFVDGFADDVQDTAECLRAHRNGDRAAGVDYLLAAHQAVRAVHGDAADGALTEFLGDFQHQDPILDLGRQRVLDERQLAVELHVHHGPENLGHASDDVAGHDGFLLKFAQVPNRYDALSERLGAGDDLDQFPGDVRLPSPVVVLAQSLDHVAGVAGGVVHRGHPRAVLTGRTLEQCPIYLD